MKYVGPLSASIWVSKQVERDPLMGNLIQRRYQVSAHIRANRAPCETRSLDMVCLS